MQIALEANAPLNQPHIKELFFYVGLQIICMMSHLCVCVCICILVRLVEGGWWNGFSWLRMGPVAGSCESSDKPSGSGGAT
jgi:hypothetical protein